MRSTGACRWAAVVGALAVGVPNARVPVSERTRPVDRWVLRSRTVVGALGRLEIDEAAAQRRAPVNAYMLPPMSTNGSAIDWLPDVRVSLPPSATIVSPPPRTFITIAPMTFETANTHVAGARGNDAMVMGLRLTLPWRIP